MILSHRECFHESEVCEIFQLSVLFSPFFLANLGHVMEYTKGMCVQVQKHTQVLQLSMHELHASGYSLNADHISSILPNFT